MRIFVVLVMILLPYSLYPFVLHNLTNSQVDISLAKENGERITAHIIGPRELL
jgi:hypothetical protein